MLNLTTSEIIEHLHDDLLSHGFLAQCIGLEPFPDEHYIAGLRQALLELLASGRVEIGSAKDLGNYVEMVGWIGTMEAKVERALEAVGATSQPDNEFVFWLSLKEKVDRYEDQADTKYTPQTTRSLAQLSPTRLMRRRIAQILKDLGGVRHQDDDDEFWVFDHPPLQVSFANPRIIELPDKFDVVVGIRVSEPAFSELASRIMQEVKHHRTLLQWDVEFGVDSEAQLTEAFMNAFQDVFRKVPHVDLRSVVRDLAADLPDRPLMRQINHLAALAWKADFLTLENYLGTFRRGKRLNFINYIDQGMIERALDAAYDRVA